MFIVIIIISLSYYHFLLVSNICNKHINQFYQFRNSFTSFGTVIPVSEQFYQFRIVLPVLPVSENEKFSEIVLPSFGFGSFGNYLVSGSILSWYYTTTTPRIMIDINKGKKNNTKDM